MQYCGIAVLFLIGEFVVRVTKSALVFSNTPKPGRNSEKKLNLYQSRSPRISQMRRPKRFLFDLIYDPDRLTGLFKLSADKNGLIIRSLKKVQKQITDHPMRQPTLGR